MSLTLDLLKRSYLNWVTEWWQTALVINVNSAGCSQARVPLGKKKEIIHCTLKIIFRRVHGRVAQLVNRLIISIVIGSVLWLMREHWPKSYLWVTFSRLYYETPDRNKPWRQYWLMVQKVSHSEEGIAVEAVRAGSTVSSCLDGSRRQKEHGQEPGITLEVLP